MRRKLPSKVSIFEKINNFPPQGKGDILTMSRKLLFENLLCKEKELLGGGCLGLSLRFRAKNTVDSHLPAHLNSEVNFLASCNL